MRRSSASIMGQPKPIDDSRNRVDNPYNIRANHIRADTDAELSVSMPILIDEQPKLTWDDDHARTQTDFLNSIDPDYFRYLARVHESQVEGDDSLHAAIV